MAVLVDSLGNKGTLAPRLKHHHLGTLDAVHRLACPRFGVVRVETAPSPICPTRLARERCMTSIIVHGAASYADRKEREPQTGERDGTITT